MIMELTFVYETFLIKLFQIIVFATPASSAFHSFRFVTEAFGSTYLMEWVTSTL